ncbi:hypothetical protein M1512_03980, partial [Patescibacteria group bacterium]|nr:hypothetical protein [Patescibacteria group bacterium]
TGATEIILFPSSYQQTAELWRIDKVVIVKGKLTAKDRGGRLSDEVKLLVEEASELSVERAAEYDKQLLSGPGAKGLDKSMRLFIRLTSSEDHQLLKQLKRTIDSYSGGTEVVLVLGPEQRKQAIKLPSGIDMNSDGPKRLRLLMGSENVVLS